MQVEPLLGPIKGMAQDFARDAMPRGYTWSLLDLLPHTQGANLRSRNPWVKTCNDATWGGTDYPIAGLYGIFSDTRKLVVVATDGKLYEIDTSSVANPTLIGTVLDCAQNPFQHRYKMIIPDSAKTSAAKIVSHSGGSWSIAALPASALEGRFGCTYKDRVVLANTSGNESRVAFSKAGDPTLAWDTDSWIDTSLPVFGVWPLRNSILVFHEASTERIRGDTPPDSSLTDPRGNMLLEPFPDRVGCFDARTIVGYRDQVLFADERGVHITDGAQTDNLTELGGFALPWRQIWDLGVTSGAAGVLGDTYIITVNLTDPPGYPHAEGGPSPEPTDQFTLLCHIPSRTWTRITNFPSTFFTASIGPENGRERLWWGNYSTDYVCEATDTIYPLHDAADIGEDPDGTVFLPSMETPWFPIGTQGRKRVKYAYIGYELESEDPNCVLVVEVAPKLFANAELFEYETLPVSLPPTTDGYTRRRVPIRKGVEGLAFRLSVEGEYNHFAFYDLGVTGWPEEPGKIR